MTPWVHLWKGGGCVSSLTTAALQTSGPTGNLSEATSLHLWARSKQSYGTRFSLHHMESPVAPPNPHHAPGGMGSSNSTPNVILTRKWVKDLLLTFDAFELWCWRRLLRVPWAVRRWNPSVLKEINPEYSLEGLMLKLNLQHFGHLTQRANSLEKTLMLGKIEGKKRRGRQRIRWLDGIIDPVDMSLSKLGEMVKVREARHAAVHGVTASRTRLSNWTTYFCRDLFHPQSTSRGFQNKTQHLVSRHSHTFSLLGNPCG